jgi:unspecific monooxygenase
VLRPILGEGLLISEGRAWKHPAPNAGAGVHAARGVDARSAHAGGDRRDGRRSEAASNAPVDLREAMQRMTPEIAGRTMFSFGMDRHGAALRDFVMEYGERLARLLFSICCCH